MSLNLHVGNVTYTEVEVHELERLLGVARAWEWSAPGRRGFTALRLDGRPIYCSCPTVICEHRQTIRDYVDDVTPTRPAA